LFPRIFNIFIEEDIIQWQDAVTEDFKTGGAFLTPVQFAEDQANFCDSKVVLQ
jgi:hypothetical protein